MSKKQGKSVPVWFNEEELKRVEEAAALMGYRALSTYIKDKVFSRGDCKDTTFAGLSELESNADLMSKIDVIAADQDILKTMLVTSLLMLKKQLSEAEQRQVGLLISESATYNVALENAGDIGTAINKLIGEHN